MQYRIKDPILPQAYNPTLENIRQELTQSIGHEHHRENVDAAKKRAVKQMMDYEGFHQMVLGADLKPMQASEIRALTEAGGARLGGEAVLNMVKLTNELGSEGLKISGTADGINADNENGTMEDKKVPLPKLELQKLDDGSHEVIKTFREFKKGFNQCLGKNPTEQHELALITWLQALDDKYFPQIFSLEFEYSYLTTIVSLFAKWVKAGKYATMQQTFAWFLDLLKKVSKQKSFNLCIKNQLKTADRMELRKTLEQIEKEDKNMGGLVEELKGSYIKN